MILLNPGPVNVSDRVRQALLQPDICHRESECSELINDIRQKLLKAFVPGEEDGSPKTGCPDFDPDYRPSQNTSLAEQ